MKTVLEVLEEAVEIIRDPSRWVQGCGAVDKDGKHTGVSDKAVRWCAVGAIFRVSGGNYDSSLFVESKMALAQAIDPQVVDSERTIIAVNDPLPPNEAHAQIIAAFDKAIANLRPTKVPLAKRKRELAAV